MNRRMERNTKQTLANLHSNAISLVFWMDTPNVVHPVVIAS